MVSMQEGMELWAIIPELILAALVLVLLPLGPLLPSARKGLATWSALAGLVAAGLTSVPMLAWPAQSVFLETYAVDPFAVFFKLIAITGAGFVLLATDGHFHGRPHAAEVPVLLLLACLAVAGLAASQDLVLIALFLQLITVSSYILVGIAKDERRATEGALKLFLFSATAGAVMLYGMSLLYGLTGTLRLPELATRLPAAGIIAGLAALGLVLVGYGFKITMAPFHFWAPDTYQGAPTPITAFLSVVPKAGGFAVLIRTVVVSFPNVLSQWEQMLAAIAALTMTLGNLFALRQTSLKRLLAYSSIAQAGYLLVGAAAARRDVLGLEGFLFYLTVYLFMNVGAFLAVEGMERQAGSDELGSLAGCGRRLPFSVGVLTVCLLSLAGFPPFGGFVGKTMLFGAALAGGWTWLAALMGANVALSLYYYARVLEVMYLRPPEGPALGREPRALRIALLGLAAGTLFTGVTPDPIAALSHHSATVLSADDLPRGLQQHPRTAGMSPAMGQRGNGGMYASQTERDISNFSRRFCIPVLSNGQGRGARIENDTGTALRRLCDTRAQRDGPIAAGPEQLSTRVPKRFG